MYYGESTTVLDDKGRITVPASFRKTMDVLGHEQWFMTRGFDRCLFLFHRDEWARIRKQASRFSSMDPKALDFKRFLFGSVSEVKPDRQGRMPVASHLRDYAGIQREVVLLGVDDHLELWSKEAWTAFQAHKESDFKDMAAKVFQPEDEGLDGMLAAAAAEGVSHA